MDFLRRAWAEIDLDKALENWEHIKQAAANRHIMPVIKADAYGHGANILADLYEKNGAEGFAVSNINEAIKLRKFGISKDILVLGFTPIKYINQLYAFNITQAVYCLDYAKQLSVAAAENSFVIKAHLKVDTGMCRIGFNCRNSDNIKAELEEILECLALPALKFEGIFTHFSSADSELPEDVNFCDKQFNLFGNVVELLKSKGFIFKYIHSSNSAASVLRSANEGNLIRPGIILYGLSPAKDLKLRYTPIPIMSVKSSISMIKTLNKDECISYGRTFVTDKPTRVATVPIGYADGYPRTLSGNGFVLICGQKAKILGRICMDQMIVDVTDIEGADIGSIVTVIGTDGKHTITIDEIAEKCGTIAYEIICNISIRMPRVYIKDNKIVEVVYLGGTL